MGNNPISRIDPDGGWDFPENPRTTVGQVHTDSDGSWAWNGSSWDGLKGTPDMLNTVSVIGSSNNMNTNFVNYFSMYRGFTFDATSAYIKKNSLIGRFDISNGTSFTNISSMANGNVYDKTLKNLSKKLAFLGLVGDIAGYYDGAKSIYDGNTSDGVFKLASNGVGQYLGNINYQYGLAWDAGGVLGEKITNTRFYNTNTIIPIQKEVIRERGLQNGWWLASDEKLYQSNIQIQKLIIQMHQQNMDKLFNN